MNLRVYTGGTFDLFHAGHVNFLAKCSELGDVTVSLNTDEFISAYKGSSPILTYAERESVLRSCSFVSDVIPNLGGADSKPAILQVMPNIIVVGSDWAKKDYYQQMQFTQEWLDENDISLCYVPYFKGVSSTDVKGRILGA